MKVLIWIGCIFVATILNTLLGEITGIKIGYLLFYFGVYFVASKLCQKWDEHKEAKKRRKEFVQTAGEHTNESNVSIGARMGVDSGINLSAASVWRCSCGRVHPLYEISCVCGKSKLDNKLAQPQPIVAAEVTNKICFCRKCGKKLIDESRFCRMCGTQVVEIMTSPE